MPGGVTGAEGFHSQRCRLHHWVALVEVVAWRSHIVDRTVVGRWDARIHMVGGNQCGLVDRLSGLRIPWSSCGVDDWLLQRSHPSRLGDSYRDLKSLGDSFSSR